MLDETVETRLPWLDFSLSRRPCRAISVLHGHNSTVSRQLRYSLSQECIRHRPCPTANCGLGDCKLRLYVLYAWWRIHRPASATLRCQDTVGIMPCKLSMLDETVETRLPWLDFSLSRHPCRDISVLHGHNSTLSRHLRYSLSRDCVSPTTPINLTFP